MAGWGEFTLAMALFAGSHFLPRLGGLRGRMIARLGRGRYFVLYGLVSLAILIWLIDAAGRAPHVELWPQTAEARWIPSLAMPVALLLAVLGMGIDQPHTPGARPNASFDADRPGLAAITRHPLLIALGLWAGAHLAPNGDLAHVILFGGFAAMSLAAIALFEARARRREGPAFFDNSAILSLRPLARRAWWRANGRPLAIRGALAAVAWLALLHAHPLLFGVSPMPR
ncbi:NnrU family protein [Paracoccus spongiarum]|uniref:NnrU family protein n=1 Tax=Paracoccus spongiarum TaxID=3064387 RepID=A0ABT9JC69_9RHOB|nr:NnrU family protein [Paracoccus sp. 2205BS29-5]MDP5307407.1 NnrU family protein [Paracoccus sp. 2205BS29-5]